MTELKHLSLSQTIAKVNSLIDAGNGDVGRLYHILEFLKNNKSLYRSDATYLENKLNSSFSVVDESKEENSLLPKVRDLIDSGNGDSGRLQSIYDALSNNKSLYNSDSIYLESKLNPPNPEILVETVAETTVEIPPEKVLPKVVEKTPEPKVVEKTPEPKVVEKTPEPKVVEKIPGSMPKGWSPEDKPEELEKISKNILDEQKKIETQTKIDHEINLQRSNLSQLISHRKEYEQKITKEKSSLESQIKEERIKIETHTKLSNEIIAQKEELEKVKKERALIIKKIDSEKIKISRELLSQKRQLVQAQLEQEKIEKQVIREQELLGKMASDQKSRLLEQAQIAHDIKSKQSELEKTKQDYDDIVSQVNEEKAKFVESEKLKKLISTQEQDLIKAKGNRLDLLNVIATEKELIAKKTEEEKLKLKSQTQLTKQLKNEEKLYESLKKKREKIESQIKIKNKKLKEKQQKLKKQIDEKDKKLKSITKKSSIKKIATKPAQKKTSEKK